MTPEEAMRISDADRKLRRDWCRKNGMHLDESDEEKRAREASGKAYEGETDRQLPTGDRK